MQKSYVSHSELDTKKIASRLKADVRELLKVKNPVFIGLKGTLGTGKSTFVRGFIESWLQNKDHAHIVSPTYNIIKTYEDVVHIDCFRIKSIDQILEAGLDEYLKKASVIFVEWPELLGSGIDLYFKIDYIVELQFDEAPERRSISIQQIPFPQMA